MVDSVLHHQVLNSSRQLKLALLFSRRGDRGHIQILTEMDQYTEILIGDLHNYIKNGGNDHSPKVVKSAFPHPRTNTEVLFLAAYT